MQRRKPSRPNSRSDTTAARHVQGSVVGLFAEDAASRELSFAILDCAHKLLLRLVRDAQMATVASKLELLATHTATRGPPVPRDLRVADSEVESRASSSHHGPSKCRALRAAESRKARSPHGGNDLRRKLPHPPCPSYARHGGLHQVPPCAAESPTASDKHRKRENRNAKGIRKR